MGNRDQRSEFEQGNRAGARSATQGPLRLGSHRLANDRRTSPALVAIVLATALFIGLAPTVFLTP